MNMALGLSIGLGATACQKTGKTSEDLAESTSVSDTPVQPDWAHVLQSEETPDFQEEKVPDPEGRYEETPDPIVKDKVMPAPETNHHRDPCPACGMG